MDKRIRFFVVVLSAAILLTGCKKKKPSKTSSLPPESSVVLTSDTSAQQTSESSIHSEVLSSEEDYIGPLSVYDGYYDNIHWENGEDLREKLCTAMHKGYTAIPYIGSSTNWETNQYADQALDDFECVDVVYAEANELKTATNLNGSGWQREHAFPASLMTGSQTGNAVKNLGRATDFHNLFASNYSGNTSRGNKNYGFSDDLSTYYQNRTTSDGNDGYSFDNKNFEPGNKDKGRLARAIFYMATMYMHDEEDIKNGITMKGLNVQEPYVNYTATGYDTFAIGNLSDLLKWNSYPVDRLEYQHAESVRTHKYEGTAQGNRNAYVDFPELVDYVFGKKKDQAGQLKDLVPTEVTLKTTSKEFSNYAIESAKRNYFVGEKPEPSDWAIVEVANDYTYKQASFTSSFEGVEFTNNDIGTKTINAPTPNGSIPFAVTVQGASIESCSWKHTFENKNVFGTTGAKIVKDGTTVNLSGVDWTFSFENDSNTAGSIPVGNSSSFGGCISIGTGSSNNWAQTLKIKSASPLNGVSSFYIKANTAANKTYYMTVYVGTTKVLSSLPITRDASQCSIVGGEFPACDGIVNVSISSVSAAFYLQQIGSSFVQ